MTEPLSAQQGEGLARCLSGAYVDFYDLAPVVVALLGEFPEIDWLSLVTDSPGTSYRDLTAKPYDPQAPWSCGPDDPLGELKAELLAADLRRNHK